METPSPLLFITNGNTLRASCAAETDTGKVNITLVEIEEFNHPETFGFRRKWRCQDDGLHRISLEGRDPLWVPPANAPDRAPTKYRFNEVNSRFAIGYGANLYRY